MSDSKNNALLQTIDKIFSNVETDKQKPVFQLPKHKNIRKAELELALTVLLVELAGCDQQFDPNEYQIIVSGLHRMFGTSRDHVQALVNQANLVLNNLRGTSKFGHLLKENLQEPEKLAIAEIIEEIINADGVEDGYETYIRHKIYDLLGLPQPPKKATEDK